ncbi:hypothetical protein TSOC_000853 [Tetrabaena socialis]|uniref:Glycosyltransferase-like protein LARGE2 n=1 Tax=Tetrabaena socialis TaxID=47790 RepID=A0A2J8AI92_9CHLO|nr:hypothetical protein TSOC_000853 [Tetrabaena socialis]|eukprot:PNH12234.1 hypothetical protein TSOC_000853 [Tetrabaena socialis]
MAHQTQRPVARSPAWHVSLGIGLCAGLSIALACVALSQGNVGTGIGSSTRRRCLRSVQEPAAGRADAMEDPAALLQKCFNCDYDPAPSTFQGYLQARPASLFLAEVWWSRRVSGLPVTIFTMASMDRMKMLEAQCRSYRGPVVAAVYLALPVSANDSSPVGTDNPVHERALRDARARLKGLFDNMEASNEACELRLLLFTERTADRQIAAMMPTNALRNAAGLAAQTDLAAMLDADISVSASFSDVVADPDWVRGVHAHAHSSPPSLCILPAWEAHPNLTRNKALDATEKVLAARPDELYLQHLIGASAVGGRAYAVLYLLGARSTPYPTILHSQTTLGARQLIPAFPAAAATIPPLAPSKQDPGYDERFRGWCFDKIQHVESLARNWKYNMVVLPDAWVVHRWHPRAAIAALSKGAARSANATGEVDALLESFKQRDGSTVTAYTKYRSYVGKTIRHARKSMGKGNYQPQLNPQLKHCRAVLPWWQ